MPVRMSPLPPVPIAGVPVGLIHTRPSGNAITVRWPFSTSVTPCSVAKARATPTRSACTSAVVLPGEPRHLAGMRREHAHAPPGHRGAAAERVGIQHHRQSQICDARATSASLPRFAAQPRPDRDHGLAFGDMLVSP